MAGVLAIPGATLFGGTGRNKVLSQTLATATETEFQLGNDTNAAQIAVLSVPSQSTIQGSQTPNDQTVNPAQLNSGFGRISYFGDPNPPYNSSSFDLSHPFQIRIAGTVTPASNAGNTYQIALYCGASKAGSKLCSTSAVAVATSTATFGFLLEAELIWDAGSQSIYGLFNYAGNGTTAAAAGPAAITKATSIAAVANLQFCATMTWGNAVGGVCAVSEFVINQI